MPQNNGLDDNVEMVSFETGGKIKYHGSEPIGPEQVEEGYAAAVGGGQPAEDPADPDEAPVHTRAPRKPRAK